MPTKGELSTALLTAGDHSHATLFRETEQPLKQNRLITTGGTILIPSVPSRTAALKQAEGFFFFSLKL